MTTFYSPDEPAGPVWDKDGFEWIRDEGSSKVYPWTNQRTDSMRYNWGELLVFRGPLTDAPPIKAGSVVDRDDVRGLPDGTVFALDAPPIHACPSIIIGNNVHSIASLSHEIGDWVRRQLPSSKYRILRVGWGIDE